MTNPRRAGQARASLLVGATLLLLAGCGGGGGGATGGAQAPAAGVSSSSPVASVPSVEPTPEPSPSVDSYIAWAQQNQVGDKLPAFALENPDSATEFAKGYCELLGDSPIQTPDLVVGVIKKHYNGSTSQSQALLEEAVSAYCPEKSKYLD